MATQLEVQVAGKWLAMEADYGNVEMSTCWPGGSDELSWSMDRDERFKGNELVTATFGGALVWSGYLLEPDASQDRVTARGAWREAEGFTALDTGNTVPTNDANLAENAAVSRGLRWAGTFPAAFVGIVSDPVVDVDLSQGPVTLSSLLDAYADGVNARWGVTPQRTFVSAFDPTTPTYQTLPLAGGLGYARDNYASTLIGRYQVSSGYKTVTVTDPVAENDHGHVEAIVDLTPRGVITSAKATTILTNMLALGRAIPQWTTGIELVYGEIFNMGNVPIALEAVTANRGRVIRAHGGYELAQRLNGLMYVDILIGRTVFTADGTLVIEPAQLADRTLAATLTRSMDATGVPDRPMGQQRAAAPKAFGARMKTGQQSIPNNTVTDATFGTAKETANGIEWDNTNGRWIVTYAGTYHVSASILWDPNGTGRRNVHLLLNGTDYAVSEKSGGALSTGSPNIELCCDVPCEAGDTLKLQVFQNSGGALNIGPASADGTRHYFSVRA